MSTILVVGACGGSGATTTTVGLADAWSLHGSSVVAVDATVGGGDLLDRAGDAIDRSSVIGTGARVTGHPCPTTAEPDYERLDWHLRHRNDAVLYDFGHLALSRDSARPLLAEASAAIVLMVPARSDAVTRSVTALQTISLIGGEKAAHRTSIVVSHQFPGPSVIDLHELRRALSGRALGVDDIPYDPHLSAGLTVTASELERRTAQAYQRIRTRIVGVRYGTMSA